MQVVDLLVIFLYPRECTRLNAFKNTKWKGKTNETGKTTFCNMWCTCIPANGTLLPRCGVSVLKSQLRARSSAGGTPPSSSMRGKHKPKHPEGGSGWEAAPHTHSHEVEYYSSFREKAPLKLFVLPSDGRGNLHLVFLTKF